MTIKTRTGPKTVPADRPPCRAGCEGSTHPRCAGHNAAGQWCGVAPIHGGTVCQSHGGSAPQVRAAAERRVEEAAIIAAVHHELGTAEPVGNPLAAILQLAGESLAWLAALRDRAQARLDSDDLTQFSVTGRTVAVEIELYERAMDKAAHVLGLAATKNVEARLTTVAERDMSRIEGAYEAVWQAGRDGLTLDEARKRAGRHLRTVG